MIFAKFMVVHAENIELLTFSKSCLRRTNKNKILRGNMRKHEKVLIMQDEDISIYNEDFLSCIPSDKCIGGVITVIDNHNNEIRFKEWKWFKHEDGTMFNDKDYVINMCKQAIKMKF